MRKWSRNHSKSSIICECYGNRLKQYITTLLPSVNTIALGTFCCAKYTHHTFTPIIKYYITTTADRHPGKKTFINKYMRNPTDISYAYHPRERDSSGVRAPDLWLKGHGFESLQERQENFVLQRQLAVLTSYFSICSTPSHMLLQ